ncbi:MAG: ArsR family transcriptional regulator [Hyphomonadaceae bacterium]|nr:MAG: ArsR family transcriptional regulator [Hyphomonadaceae bacterium]
MKTTIDILRAAGEVTRLRILALLSYGELTAGELSSVLGQSQPRVSRHLKLLVEANIINRRPEGAWVFVRLSNQEPASGLIKTILSTLNKNDELLVRDNARLHEIKNQREAQAKAYFETIAGEWQSLRKLHQPEAAVEKAMLQLVKGKRFDFHLDLGSGFGDLLEAFAKQTKSGEGIDRSRGMLAMARARFDDRNDSHICVRMGDIMALPYQVGAADLITIHQVLHYLSNPQAAIKEAARVLKPNGVLLIADFAQHEFEELREKFGHLRLGFDPQEISDWCKEAGLKVEKIINVKDSENQTSLAVNVFAATINGQA